MVSNPTTPRFKGRAGLLCAFAKLVRLPVGILAALAGVATLYALNPAASFRQYCDSRQGSWPVCIPPPVPSTTTGILIKIASTIQSVLYPPVDFPLLKPGGHQSFSLEQP